MQKLDYIRLFDMKPHPEGGHFCDFFRSNNKVIYSHNMSNKDHTAVERCAGTSIYYYLEKKEFSTWHRLKSDEIWHFYDGKPVMIYVIDNQGRLHLTVLGRLDQYECASLQVVIKADAWFAAELIDKDSFALMGCTVSPGFEYRDFEIPQTDKFILEHQQHADIIKKFLR